MTSALPLDGEVESVEVRYPRFGDRVTETNLIGGFPEHLPGVARGVFISHVAGCLERVDEVVAVTPGSPTTEEPLREVLVVMRTRDGSRDTVLAVDLGTYEVVDGWPDNYPVPEDPSDDECLLCGFPTFDCKCEWDDFDEETCS